MGCGVDLADTSQKKLRLTTFLTFQTTLVVGQPASSVPDSKTKPPVDCSRRREPHDCLNASKTANEVDHEPCL